MKRYFIFVVGSARYVVVAGDPSAAWVMIGFEIVAAQLGEDLLGEAVTMLEIPAEGAADRMVRDEKEERRYPLSEAAIGSVFCSEQ